MEEFEVGVRAVEGEMGVIIRNGTAVVHIVDDDGMFVVDCTTISGICLLHPFSCFSVGSCINREKGYLLPT